MHLGNDAPLRQEWTQARPFPHLTVPGFLDTDGVLRLLKELSACAFSLKESDLFTFLQTNDLNTHDSRAIQDARSYLTSKETIAALEAITGKRLAPKVDLHATIYQDTHHLLCHDDAIKGRALAFMIYLSDMTSTSGGQLQLYAKKAGAPTVVTKELTPHAGDLVIIGVGDGSWHAVKEVVQDRQRITLAGWYHAR